MNRVHQKSGSLKSVHLDSSSSKSVHWKLCSEQCLFTQSLICGWPAQEHYVAPVIINWRYLIITNLFKSVCLNHIFAFLCLHLCCIHVNLVRAHTSYCFCTLPSWQEDSLKFPNTVLQNVWVNPEFLMSQYFQRTGLCMSTSRQSTGALLNTTTACIQNFFFSHTRWSCSFQCSLWD